MDSLLQVLIYKTSIQALNSGKDEILLGLHEEKQLV